METAAKTAPADGPHVLAGLFDLQSEICRMAGGARQRILIYDGQLNPAVYEQPCMVEAMKQLAIRHAGTHVQILLADTERLRKGGHRLLTLVRRLPSAIEIRLRAEQFSGDLRSFMLVDDADSIYYPVWHDLRDGVAESGNRFRVRELAQDFTRIWEQSAVDPGLRQLSV